MPEFYDLTGDRYAKKTGKVSFLKRLYLELVHTKDVILNWLILPFQLTLIKDPPMTNMEVKILSDAHIAIRGDLSYYSSNLSADGHTHDYNNQVMNHAIHMFLYDIADEVVDRGRLYFLGYNIQANKAMSNGIYWSQDGIHYAGLNTSTKEIAALNLVMLKPNFVQKSTLTQIYETFLSNVLDNGCAMPYICNPGGKLKDTYEKMLKEANFRPEAVNLKNPNTFMGLGSSPDQAVVMLASLAILGKVCNNSKMMRLYNKYKNLYGFGIKAKFTTNSFEAVSSLFVLWKLTKDETYHNILLNLFETTNVDEAFNSYVYGVLTGANHV